MRNLIAVPCYNCSSQVLRVIESLDEFFSKFTDFECILIDNRSTDSTVESIRKKLKESRNKSLFKLLQNSENYGLGGSHKVAFDYAIENRFERIIILHGDDQASVDDISRLLTSSENYSLTVLGSRFKQGALRENYQLTRVIGNRVLNIIFSLILLRNINDLGSGLNVFKVSDLAHINYKDLSDFFNFNVELLLTFHQSKINFYYEGIHWRESDQVSNARNVSVALSMLKSLFKYCFYRSVGHKSERNYEFKVVEV